MNCIIDDCTLPVLARKMCNKHYRRFKRTGSAGDTKWHKQDKNAKEKVCRDCEQLLPIDNFDKVNSEYRRKDCKVCRSWQTRRKQHSLTPQQMNALLKQSNGRCVSCNLETTKLFLDHDHACCNFKLGKDSNILSCGKCVRGLICVTCNLLAGHIEKDIERVPKVVEYLKRF